MSKHTIHPCEPGIPGWFYDHIIGVDKTPDYPVFEWKVSFQGELDFNHRNGKRYSFRRSKIGWGDGKNWNFKTQEEFEAEINGSWGILHHGSDPVTQEELDAFRREHYPSAVTGYWDHKTNSWVECEPTSEQLGSRSFIESGKWAAFCADNPQLQLSSSANL